MATGEQIARDAMLPGAVLTRVAASHLRVGTFEYAAAHGDPTLVRRLADHAIVRHYPHAAEADNPYLAFFEGVVDAQASLVARWMLVGFIHGVMNTDNMTISGETIDFGPCAFMDAFDPATVFSSMITAAGTPTATSRRSRSGTWRGWPRHCCPCSTSTRMRPLPRPATWSSPSLPAITGTGVMGCVPSWASAIPNAAIGS